MIADQKFATIGPGIYSLCVPSDADRAASRAAGRR